LTGCADPSVLHRFTERKNAAQNKAAQRSYELMVIFSLP
jgi:hypothetical protein